MTLNYTTITGTFQDGAGNPLSGTVVFTPSAVILDGVVPLFSPAAPVTTALSGGMLSVALLATDNAGVTWESQAAFWFWTVQLNLGTGSPPAWQFFLPSSPATVDITALTATSGGGGGGSGSVTSVAVETANGLAGTVADSTTTPQITLETTITGLLKGNGTAISAASAGTDYLAPAGSGAALTGITVSQVSGAAPLASPALSGSPTAPTKTALNNSTDIATTAYADAAVAVETGRAETAEALALPKAGGTLTGALIPSVVTLTDAATIAVNAAAGNAFTVTLAGNRTLGTPSNPANGQQIRFEIIQDSTGSRTLAYSGAYAFPASIPSPTLSSTAGQRDFLSFIYDAGVSLWQCVGWVPDQNAGIVTIPQGGTGQSTQQAAINALAGAQTSGFYLRGTGTNVQMAAIQAGDLAAGVDFDGGIFGTGADGSVTFDGTTTILGLVPSSSIYTMTRDIMCTSITISNGVTLKPAGYRIFCRGTVTNNGTISVAGNAASAGTAGALTGAASIGGGVAGGNGGTGVSGAGANGGAAAFGIAGGNGGAGTSGGAGTGGTAGVSSTIAQNVILQTPYPVLNGICSYNVTTRAIQFGAGGAGGGSDASSNAGGGGGGGGGIVAIMAFAVNNGSGTITVAGGAGAAGTGGNAGGGGGGSGGLIIAYTLAAWTAGTLTVSGGALGAKAGSGSGSNGVAGGTGLALNVVLS